ncbi:hypothetical protein EMIHUDRAFT_363375, partial [Emiliania huxleyi CCMP1516]|uniref:Uncharacterized protein n=2 Tax=Emiliania huxleyi TaxID=2903 RepID=A0A0D3KFU4_EMIH1
ARVVGCTRLQPPPERLHASQRPAARRSARAPVRPRRNSGRLRAPPRAVARRALARTRPLRRARTRRGTPSP